MLYEPGLCLPVLGLTNLNQKTPKLLRFRKPLWLRLGSLLKLMLARTMSLRQQASGTPSNARRPMDICSRPSLIHFLVRMHFPCVFTRATACIRANFPSFRTGCTSLPAPTRPQIGHSLGIVNPGNLYISVTGPKPRTKSSFPSLNGRTTN